jgi:hypothetical protein
VGDIDTQIDTLKDLIVAYNTIELDFDISLGEGDGDEEGDEEEDEEDDE